jgi:HEPN domain-containing protein
MKEEAKQCALPDHVLNRADAEAALETAREVYERIRKMVS